MPVDQKVTIILTSTVIVSPYKIFIRQRDKKERLNVYLKSIRQWLEKTNFHIILAENSNYPFDELFEERIKYKDRFEILSFDEKILNNEGLLTCNSKGVSEIYAINYAYDNSKLKTNSVFFIKITGRYFIPDLEKYLSQFDLTKYNCFTQTSHTRCEMVGSDINNFKTVFDEKIFATHNTLYDPHIENVYKYRTSLINNHIPPKLFQIEPTQGGGCNCIFKTI